MTFFYCYTSLAFQTGHSTLDCVVVKVTFYMKLGIWNLLLLATQAIRLE